MQCVLVGVGTMYDINLFYIHSKKNFSIFCSRWNAYNSNVLYGAVF